MSGGDDDDQPSPPRKTRWLIVLLFDLVSLVNGILWISYTPVNSYAQSYYQVAPGRIDLLSTIYMIMFAPGVVLCAYATRRVGLRWTCIGAAGLNLFAALMRYGGGGIYGVALIGQMAGGLAQPISISLPARIATVWFGQDQRVLAIALLSLSNLFGVAVGQILPGLFVADTASGFPALHLCITAMAAVALISCLLGFKEGPRPTDRAGPRPTAPVVAELTAGFLCLWRSASFVALSVGFGLGLAVFNVVLTKIELIVSVGRFTSDEAGVFGATCMLGGFIGSGIFGSVLDATHAYSRVLRSGTIASLVVLHILFVALRSGASFAAICAVFGALGFVLVPLMPICIECGAISTSPVSEEISTGVLMLVGNILGFLGSLATGDYTAGTFLPAVSRGNMILSLAFVIAAIANMFYRNPIQQVAPIRPPPL